MCTKQYDFTCFNVDVKDKTLACPVFLYFLLIHSYKRIQLFIYDFLGVNFLNAKLTRFLFFLREFNEFSFKITPRIHLFQMEINPKKIIWNYRGKKIYTYALIISNRVNFRGFYSAQPKMKSTCARVRASVYGFQFTWNLNFKLICQSTHN